MAETEQRIACLSSLLVRSGRSIFLGDSYESIFEARLAEVATTDGHKD